MVGHTDLCEKPVLPVDLHHTIQQLWTQAFGTADGLTLSPCPVSGNNRVFIGQCGNQQAIVKWYFRGPQEERNRLDAEWRFLRYAQQIGVSQAPAPILCAPDAGLSLQEYLPGRKPVLDDIGLPQVLAAADFLRDLNRDPHRIQTADVLQAAETAFDVPSQCAIIERRLARLAFIPASDVDQRAAMLVGKMQDFWRRLQPQIEQQFQAAQVSPEQALPQEQWCISPADFGFHNAILAQDGGVRFFDFEYGGWDDPAKTIADFFLQPAIPIDWAYRSAFIQRFLADWPAGEAIARRAEILTPLFALKWCCIILNPFSAQRAAAAQFADPNGDELARKERQLAKALLAFEQLRNRGETSC